MVQVMTHNLNTRDPSQSIQTAHNRLALNLEGNYREKALFLIELEQFQNRFDRSLEINQFFVESIQNSEETAWIWGVGYMPIPISKLNILDDQLFLGTPFFHRDFFTDDRQLIESGLYFGYQKSRIQIRSGAFQRIKASSASPVAQYAEIAPHFLQMKLFWFGGESSLTYYSEKAAGLPSRENFGLSSYHEFHQRIVFDLEAWRHNRAFSRENIEESLGGYFYSGIFFSKKKIELGMRFDFLQRLNLVNAWGNPTYNLSFNAAPIVRLSILPELFLQFEHINENQILRNQQTPGLTGWILQISYSAKF